ncbi:MAG TPA: transcriptional regulator [Terriglobia bacterium]|nr:transcriptional regulator [Terriglobia bacterium]
MARQSNLARRREPDMAPAPVTSSATSVPGEGPASPAPARAAEKRPLELDRLIHEHIRLGIVSALAVNNSLSFNDLKKLLATTDGNLSVHARKLEEAGYVSCSKFFDKRVPKTEYRLTAAGRKALERYLNHMESLIRAMRQR